jgi:hypothetical protein
MQTTAQPLPAAIADTPPPGRADAVDRARFALDQRHAWLVEYERTGCFAAAGLADFWLMRAADAVEAM